MLDLSTDCVKFPHTTLPLKRLKRTPAEYVKILRGYNIRTDGGLERLEWRFAELVTELSYEQFKEEPPGVLDIAQRISRAETLARSHRQMDHSKVMEALLRLRKEAAAKLTALESMTEEAADPGNV